MDSQSALVIVQLANVYWMRSTRVAPGTKVGWYSSNKLSWSATNFPGRTSNQSLHWVEAGSGDGSAERSKDIIIKAQKNSGR